MITKKELLEAEAKSSSDNYIEGEGKVIKVVYYNQESSWGVLAVENNLSTKEGKGATITLTGNFSRVHEDSTVHYTGVITEHPTYGEQVSVTSVCLVADESTKEGVINFLVHAEISGISTQLAEHIWDTFGTNSISVVLTNPDRLIEVKGIGDYTVESVKVSVQKYHDMQDTIKFLSTYGMPFGTMKLIYDYYTTKDNTNRCLSVIKSNIYAILGEVKGVSFTVIDRVAFAMGYKPEDPRRLTASILHCLQQRTTVTSSTGCFLMELKRDFTKLTGIDNTSLFMALLKSPFISKRVVREENEVYYKPFYNMEDYIAKSLISLRNTPLSIDWNDKIVEDELQSFDFELNIEQKRAIKGVLNNRVSVITGGPGSGKSTITKAVVDIVKRHGLDVVLLCPTGKATRRLSECTGSEAQTIHKYLGLGFSIADVFTLPRLKRDTFIIIDECSMTDLNMMSRISSICDTTPIHLIAIGDIDQLPSVQAGSVLDDLIKSRVISVFWLKDILRQAENSNIIKYCSRVNNGKMIPECDTRDFFYREYFTESEVTEELLDIYAKEVRTHGLSEVQVITPYKKGILGTGALNELLAENFNDNILDPNRPYRVGDKVIQIVNNYKMNVFNGETGVVVGFDDKKTLINFNDSIKEYTPEATKLETQLAYAITCHKSQGSEYEVVIVVLSDCSGNFLLTRKLLYTAMSRGKHKVYVLGTTDSVRKCVKNDYEQTRITKLYNLIPSYNGKIKTTSENWYDIPNPFSDLIESPNPPNEIIQLASII